MRPWSAGGSAWAGGCCRRRACALGVLTKGPVALVLILVPTTAYALLERRSARVGLRGWLAYLAVVLAWRGRGTPPSALPSRISPSPSFGGTTSSASWRRSTTRSRCGSTCRCCWWACCPGACCCPASFVFLARRSARAAARRPAALGFFLLAAAWSLVFFSAAGCKRAVYILPALPPLALALGCYLNALIPIGAIRESWGRLWRRGSQLAYRSSVVVLAVGGRGGPVRRRSSLHPHLHRLRPRRRRGRSGGPVDRVLSQDFVAGLRHGHLRRAARAILVGQPAYNRQFSLRDCCATCRNSRLYRWYAIRNSGIR